VTQLFRWFLAVACSPLLVIASAHAQETSLVSLKTPRGATQKFILIKPAKPAASVILFAGGAGNLRLKNAQSMAWGSGNFLVRTRGKFAAHNLMVAVADAPSDRQSGMNAEFRTGGGHAGDISAMAAYLKKQADVPVWLVGTSMGTFSAAGGAIAAKDIDGVVLTSSITRSSPEWRIARSFPDGVASMRLHQVKMPALIVSHAKDACEHTPAADASKLRSRLANAKPVEVVVLDGGDPPKSEPCQAYSQHGFLGIESKAVDTIAKFILANTKN
jgi:dienelactone hydrolase